MPSGLRHPDVIDLIAASREGTRVDLYVLDSGDVAEPEARIAALHRKVATCAGWVMDGLWRERAPNAEPHAITVRVVCRDAPTPAMRLIRGIRTSLPGEPAHELAVTVEHESEFQQRMTRELGATPPSFFAPSKPWWKFW